MVSGQTTKKSLFLCVSFLSEQGGPVHNLHRGQLPRRREQHCYCFPGARQRERQRRLPERETASMCRTIPRQVMCHLHRKRGDRAQRQLLEMAYGQGSDPGSSDRNILSQASNLVCSRVDRRIRCQSTSGQPCVFVYSCMQRAVSLRQSSPCLQEEVSAGAQTH